MATDGAILRDGVVAGESKWMADARRGDCDRESDREAENSGPDFGMTLPTKFLMIEASEPLSLLIW
jgi:hypothetical protein